VSEASARDTEIAGYPLLVPMFDIQTIGAGGGSIARVDEAGAFKVGPRSAGAVPGPACYGIGGERPTVTDANVALGFLNPAHLAGGELRLHAPRAHEAIRRYVAGPLRLSVAVAAHGIRQVANANMARAIRSVTIERGRDPRDYTLVAFGGSGPVHAVDVARALEIRRVLVPISPGVFTAVGMLASDLQHHFVRAHAAPLSTMSFPAANKVAEEMARDARETLAAEGYADTHCALAFHADLRYAGQGSELSVPLPDGVFDAAGVAALRAAFKREYTTTYGYATDEDLELVNLRLVATGMRADRLDFRRLDVSAKPSAAARRLVTFDRHAAAVDTPVVPREHVRTLAGPAIIESYESTVVVPPGCDVRTDSCGNLVITIQD